MKHNVDLNAIWRTVIAEHAQVPATLEAARDAACPTPSRFLQGVESGWEDRNDRDHVTACHFCQNSVSLYWRAVGECPNLRAVFRYLLLGSRFEDAEAMQLHLRRDGCPRCARRLQSTSLIRAADWVESGERTLDQIQSGLEKVIEIFVPRRERLIPVTADGYICDPYTVPLMLLEKNEHATLALREDEGGHLQIKASAVGSAFGNGHLEIFSTAVDDADSGVRRDAAEALGKLGEAQRSLDLAAGETALASVSAEEPVLLLIIPEL
jgi:hypothetical protein